eukprot:m.170788 g.170788  ORF g.170788 m.170788 type:complete len:443 (+) comp14536_c0_seq12:69-1397(+)
MGQAESKPAVHPLSSVHVTPQSIADRTRETLQSIEANSPYMVKADFTDAKGVLVMEDLIKAFHINTNVKELILVNTGITVQNAQQLTALLCSTFSTLGIETLDVSQNQLGFPGAQSIADAVRNLPSLKHIKMNNCGINDSGAQCIARALRNNTHVKSISLGQNSITAASMGDFAEIIRSNLQFQGISLFHNPIGADGIKELTEHVRGNRNFAWLGIAAVNLGADGVRHLVHNLQGSNLAWLGVGANNLGDDGVYTLSSWIQQEECSLRSIGLGGNDISDTGFQHLSFAMRSNAQCGITHLGLGGNRLSYYACCDLREVLKTSASLQSLILSSNDVNDMGAEEIAKGLMNNTTLQILMLAKNPIGDEGLDRLREVLGNPGVAIKSINIQGVSASQEAVSRFCGSFSNGSSKLEEIGCSYREEEVDSDNWRALTKKQEIYQTDY